ncbi:alpha-amylase family glycosyl hydrolase [Lachnospiraceae bacterium JLR.KK008]
MYMNMAERGEGTHCGQRNWIAVTGLSVTDTLAIEDYLEGKTCMRDKSYYPKGVTVVDRGIQFVFKIEEPAADIKIGIFAGERELMRVPVSESCRQGQMYSVLLEDLPEKADSYCYYADGREICDFYARGVVGMRCYGQEKGALRYELPRGSYEWGDEVRPLHSYGQSVIYGLHVRGFTKHTSSAVKKKGTFAGVREKIPYLRELGITAVELMPAYEFDEIDKTESTYQKEAEIKINYWGFKAGYYYAPKSAYAYGRNAAAEMKDMVRELHKAGIEVLMQFYFPEKTAAAEIPDILRFWVEEYHIDGFHLIGGDAPVVILATDPFLKDTKLIGTHLPLEKIYPKKKGSWNRNLAFWRESFPYDMRKALKGDEGCINAMLSHLQDNEEKAGVVNAIAGYGGFTLQDLVSYDRKHNEENGEENKDGESYNNSWNCGVEGSTRKRSIRLLRRQQMRNALGLVFLSQGVPYLQSGDEFGQTQNGNNNPYCQDNSVTWLDWKLLKSNQDFVDYTKKLIGFRRNHAVFHREQVLKGIDYLGYGNPDISFHGEEAWKPALDHSSRHVGVLYCGKYAQNKGGEKDSDFYVVYNMHWEPHEFALPKLRKEMEWKLCMDTSVPTGYLSEEEEEAVSLSGGIALAGARTIQIYQSRKKEEH